MPDPITPSTPTPVRPDADLPKPRPRVVICPYCGCRTEEAASCSQCQGRFDPLSRQATQNTMGPWFVRDERRPNAPGCSFASLVKLIKAGAVGPDTVIRGPTTRQFWMLAKHTPGVANRLGVCHNCGKDAGEDDFSCGGCGAVFTVETDRQFLGLGPVRELSQTPLSDPVGAPPRPVPPRPTLDPREAATTNRASSPHTPGVKRPVPFVPRARLISRRRLAVNLLVGSAVFVLVLGLVLSTLKIAPSEVFERLAAEPGSGEEQSKDAGSKVVVQRTPEQPGALQSFGPGEAAPTEATSIAATDNSAADVESDEAQPVISSTQRVQDRAMEVLQLGDPVAIRQSLLALDALLASPRPPEWAAPMRDRLQARLERLQFARLP